MAGRKKPAPPGEEGGAPAWMNTYGDMVTLLLTFFVLLFSMSTIDARKWEELVQSFTRAPYVAVQALNADEVIEEALRGNSWEPSLATTPTEQEAEHDTNLSGNRKRFVELYEMIQSYIKRNGLESVLQATKMDDDSILIRMTDRALFDSGKVDIKPEALPILNDTCAILDSYHDLIETVWIQGHTDNVPIHSDRYKDNSDLSAMRATSVRRYMLGIMEKIDPAKLVAEGFGEYRPVDTNETEEGRANNRRVDFVIQAKLEE